MSHCPVRPFLDLDRFAQGTPRADLDDLRRRHRILWEPDAFATGGHWLLFDQKDIDHVLQTPASFSSAQGPLLDDFPAEVLVDQQQSMTFMDPPLHRRYRALVEGAFRPQALKAREPVMRELARQIIDDVVDRGECEFVGEVAIQLPMRVMFHVLGVSEHDFGHVVDLANTLALADDPDFAENRQAGFVASIELIDFGAALAADHRARPRDSLTSEVLSAEIDGERLDDREFGRFFNNLVVGGIETTRNTLAWALFEFIQHPEQYAAMQGDPSLVTGAVEEILRYRNPVVYLRRTATQALELAGASIKKGDKLVCILGSPNRDSAFFERPDEFDIRRPVAVTRRNYRTFGAGPHFCLGINQARLNLSVMLDEIARRIDNPRLLEPPRHARSIFMDGFKELRVAFDKRG